MASPILSWQHHALQPICYRFCNSGSDISEAWINSCEEFGGEAIANFADCFVTVGMIRNVVFYSV